MAKTNNLKDYLTDLYEGIKAKKPNASRNPQNFRSEIESIVTDIDGVEASNNDTEITITKSKSALYVDADIDYIGLEHNAYVVIDSEDGSNEVEIDMNSGKVIADNLIPENIKKGTHILGVTGEFEGEGGIEGVTADEDGYITIEANAPYDNITVEKSNAYMEVIAENVNISCNGEVTVTCDSGTVTAPNLEPQNIVKDVNILGVVGTYEGGSSGNTLKNLLDNTKSAKYLFYGYKSDNLSELIKYNDTENVEKFNAMFFSCETPKTILLNTSKGIEFEEMYRNNYYLLGSVVLNTDNATKMYSAFYSCWRLSKIDLSYYNFSTTGATNQTFRECRSLKALIIRSFGANYILNSSAFNNCYHILGTTDSTYNPNGDQDGYIYIPRNMISILSNETNWSTVATQFRALEDYTKDGTTTGEFDDEKAGL